MYHAALGAVRAGSVRPQGVGAVLPGQIDAVGTEVAVVYLALVADGPDDILGHRAAQSQVFLCEWPHETEETVDCRVAGSGAGDIGISHT